MLCRYNAPDESGSYDSEPGSSESSQDSDGSESASPSRKKPRTVPELRNLCWNQIQSLDVDDYSAKSSITGF